MSIALLGEAFEALAAPRLFTSPQNPEKSVRKSGNRLPICLISSNALQSVFGREVAEKARFRKFPEN